MGLIAALWFGGVVATQRGLWHAPWVVGVDLHGKAQVGVAYNVTVFTHCGLRNVQFDGSSWGIFGDLDDGSGNPPPGFMNPMDQGTIVLTTRDSAVYYAQMGATRSLERDTGLPDLLCV